jgi:hypothetical protein
MLIDGYNLFPLEKLYPRLHGYFMSSLHYIYSTRGLTDALMRVEGRLANSTTYYTLDGGVSYTDIDLFRQARKHPDWYQETCTGATIDATFTPPNVHQDRSHALTVNEAIVKRGVIIASIEDDKLIFGKNPKMHVGEKSWKAEMERLATVAPGRKFVALQIVASVVAGGVTWG